MPEHLADYCPPEPRKPVTCRGLRVALLCLTLVVPPLGLASEQRQTPDDAGLQLASVHAAVADLSSGQTLFRKDAERAVPIASITKVMTAMVALDAGQPMNQWLTVVERAEPAPNNGYSRIRIGSQLQRADLLRIMLMSSENRAAYTLAHYHPDGLQGFVAAMNRKAWALGMRDTEFVDPTGLYPGNRASASDLLKMLEAAAGYDRLRAYTSTERYVAHFRKPSYRLTYGNTNFLVHHDGWDIDLSKTGYLNEAGRCLMVLTEIDGRRLAVVLLNAFGKHSPGGDVGRIKRWLQTGSGGRVAPAALAYERSKTQAYRQADRREVSSQTILAAGENRARTAATAQGQTAHGEHDPRDLLRIPSLHYRLGAPTIE